MSWNINGLMNGILAFGEILLCYVWLCEVIIEKDYLRIRDKIVLFSTIILLSIMLMINRKHVFVSYGMLIISILITSISVLIVLRRNILIIIANVTAYYLIIELLNTILAFLSMSFLKNRFDNYVYFNAASIWKSCIYFFSLIFIIVIILLLKKKMTITGKISIAKYTNILIIVDFILYMVWRQYQTIMDSMALGDQEMRGLGTGVSLLAMIIFVGLGVIVFLRYKMIEEDNRNYLLRDEVYKNNFIEIDSVLEENRQMLHDVKNHFLIIRELGEKNKIEELLQYIDELYDEYNNVGSHTWTGNRIIDLVLNQKKSMAEQKKIKFNVDAMLLPYVNLSDVEICSLFGNLLDNAIEACEKNELKERVIEVSIKAQKELLFINIVNSLGVEPIRKNNRFVSSKKDKGIHGYGLKSVERIVNKYEGVISYQVESNMFKVNVTFFDMINII